MSPQHVGPNPGSMHRGLNSLLISSCTEFLVSQNIDNGNATGRTDDFFFGWTGNGSLTVEELCDRASVWKKQGDILRDKWMSVELEEVGMGIPAGKYLTL